MTLPPWSRTIDAALVAAQFLALRESGAACRSCRKPLAWRLSDTCVAVTVACCSFAGHIPICTMGKDWVSHVRSELEAWVVIPTSS